MKNLCELKPGDKFYFLPGRAIAEDGDVITECTVSKVVSLDNGTSANVYCEKLNRGLYPVFCARVCDGEWFMDKYGWYATSFDVLKSERIAYLENCIRQNNEELTNTLKMYNERTEAYMNEITRTSKMTL